MQFNPLDSIPDLIELNLHTPASDVYKSLLDARVVILNSPIDDQVATVIIAQFLYLERLNSKEPIHFYINSPGGIVSFGLAIYDTMTNLETPIATYAFGAVAGMATVLLAAEPKEIAMLLIIH